MQKPSLILPQISYLFVIPDWITGFPDLNSLQHSRVPELPVNKFSLEGVGTSVVVALYASYKVRVCRVEDFYQGCQRGLKWVVLFDLKLAIQIQQYELLSLIQFRMYNVQCTKVQCTVYYVHCTLYSVYLP